MANVARPQIVTEPSIEKVKNIVPNMKNNKVPRSDNLPGTLFKYGGGALCMKLHELHELPEEWKLRIICPVYKKGDKFEYRNCKGINLLNTAYKAFVNILVNTRIVSQ